MSHSRTRLAVLALLLACGGDGGIEPDPPPTSAFPAVYELAALRTPYSPGTVHVQPVGYCDKRQESAIEAATLTFRGGGRWVLDVTAWERGEFPTAYGGCDYQLHDLSGTYEGRWERSSSGELTMHIDPGHFFGATTSTSYFPRELVLEIAGYRYINDRYPWPLLEPSTWERGG